MLFNKYIQKWNQFIMIYLEIHMIFLKYNWLNYFNLKNKYNRIIDNTLIHFTLIKCF